MDTTDDIDISEPAILAWLDERKDIHLRARGMLPTLQSLLEEFALLRRQGRLNAKYLKSWRDQPVAESVGRHHNQKQRIPHLRLIYSRD